MRKLHRLAIAALFPLAGLATPAGAAVNLGFELLDGNGDIVGWDKNGPALPVHFYYNPYNGYAAHDGDYMAAVQAGLGMDIYSTLSQTFTLAAGERLTGYAGFLANDYLISPAAAKFSDSAYLSVNGTNVLYWDVGTVGDFGASGWTKFVFVAPAAGNYLLELGVADHGDDQMSSLAVLDSIAVLPPSVPEPASWALMVGGFGLIGGTLRARTRKVSFG